MKVAVFGASGLFGEEIADVFSTKHEVIRFERIDQADVRKLDEVMEALREVDPDLIINATGYRNPDDCKRNRDVALSVNTLGPKNLALAAVKYDCDFMHISSDSVFSGNTKWPYSEFDIPDAETVYGYTKIQAEKEIRAMTSKHYIIRVPMLFGFKGPEEANLMFQVWNNMKAGKVMYGATDQICNPTYTKDAAENLMMIAESGYYGIYHINNEGLGSRYDLLLAFARAKGLTTEHIRTINSEVKYDKRSTYTVFNSIAFKHTFNVQLEDWKDALKRCMEDYEASIQEKK